MYWTSIVIECHCFCEEDAEGKAPCGRGVPAAFCLGDGEHCPHFAWGVSSEREAAKFVPFYRILKDRLGSWFYGACDRVRWWFWDSLWFNRRKVDEFFANIKVVDDPIIIKRWANEHKKAQKKFEKWVESR